MLGSVLVYKVDRSLLSWRPCSRRRQIGLWVKASPLPVFDNKVLLVLNHTIHVHVVGGCFPAITGELSSWGRDGIALRPENIYPESLRLRGFAPRKVSGGGMNTAAIETYTVPAIAQFAGLQRRG